MGSRNKATIVLEKMMADDGEGVINAVLEAAKGGDMQAGPHHPGSHLPAQERAPH